MFPVHRTRRFFLVIIAVLALALLAWPAVVMAQAGDDAQVGAQAQTGGYAQAGSQAAPAGPFTSQLPGPVNEYIQRLLDQLGVIVANNSRAQAAPQSGSAVEPSAEPRLSEEEAKKLASASQSVTSVLLKHPELDRHASYDPSTRIWDVTWTDILSGRQLIDVRVDDMNGSLLSVDIKQAAWLDTLPLMSEDEAISVAQSQQNVRDEIAGREVNPTATLGDDGVWTVSFYAGPEEIARVTVYDATGGIREVMVGPQVAWQMARGYSGAFGRIVNEPYVWLPLCLLFLLPFIDVRRPLRWIHLDLLVLLSFTISHYFFNQGEIFRSVPLAYPPLAYLFVRLGWIGWTSWMGREPKKPKKPQPQKVETPQPGATSTPAAPQPGAAAEPAVVPATTRLPHLNFSPRFILVGLILLVIFRITLNIADSNVVDVGYSGVIGAHRILEGKTPYGNMPSDDENGDTYAPFNYLLYVPFERVLPWSGSWDDLPAAHAAAIFFDLAAIGGMFFAGRALMPGRRDGNTLGLALAYGWAAFPYTTFVLNCNVNDTIVAAFIIWGFVFLRRRLLSGLMLGVATMTKFFPALLLPLWASFPHAFRGWGRRLLFLLGVAIAVGVSLPVIFIGDGTFHTFLERSLRWQMDRDSPFSIWGQYKDHLAGVQQAGQYFVAGLAVFSYFWPMRKTMTGVAAVSAALIVGFQIFQTHWFYLYIPWFFPLALIAFLMASGMEKPRPLPLWHAGMSDMRPLPGRYQKRDGVTVA